MVEPKGLRVAPGPSCHRGRALSFKHDGRRVEAFEGETVGAALHAADTRVFMRSIKYHRPRGLFCNTGKCANCLVRVDGTPNVRACVTPVHDGMSVETQNAFPSARRDLFAVVDKVYPKNFDYHRRFIRPKFLAPLYHRVIRMMAGFGKVPDEAPVPPRRPAIRRVETDVLVVGGGASGLAAAAAAAEGAARVMLVEESDRLGGALLLDAEHNETLDELVSRIQDADGVTHVRSVAFGAYLTDGKGDALAAPGVVAIMTPERILEVRAKSLVVASGHHETPPLFPGNDLPGIMGVRAGLILLHRHGVLPGRHVALVGSGALLDVAARDLAAAGATVVRIDADARVVAAQGGTRVETLVVDRAGAHESIPVDCVLAGGDETPRVELLQQCGAKLVWHDAYVPEVDGANTSVAGVFATGSVLGMRSLEARLAEGARAGEAAARYARREVPA